MTTNELKEILLCCVCINSYRVYFGQIVSYIKADSRQFINPLRDLTFVSKIKCRWLLGTSVRERMPL